MWTGVNCCLIWHRKTDVESWHGQVFLNTNLSYLRFCFQSPELSSVTSVHPLSLSNSPWPPHGLISLNLAVFPVTSTLMTWLYSWVPGWHTSMQPSYSQRHLMRNARAAAVSPWEQKLSSQSLAEPIPFSVLEGLVRVHTWISFHYFALQWFYFAGVHSCSVLFPKHSFIYFHLDVSEHSINANEITKLISLLSGRKDNDIIVSVLGKEKFREKKFIGKKSLVNKPYIQDYSG